MNKINHSLIHFFFDLDTDFFNGYYFCGLDLDFLFTLPYFY